MATKAQWKQPDGEGGFEIIHHETSADAVRYSDTTVADVLDNTAILTASSFMESLLSAENAFEAREILRVGKEIFYDETGKRWANTAALISPTQKKFGETSMSLNGAAYLRRAAGITLGGKDFTIACYGYPTAASASTSNNILGWGDDSNRFAIWRSTSNKLGWHCYSGGTSVFVSSGMASQPDITTNEWFHLEVDYRNSDNMLMLFLNGEKIDEQVVTALATAASRPLFIGRHPSSEWFFTGYLDEFIITEQLLHTENFTPPTEPYAFDSDTTIALLHFE